MADVVVPQLGESISEAVIARWLKQVGDSVKRDEPLFEISTDKVDAEIPAPSSGVLSEIKVQEGETVAVNTVVAVINGGEAKPAAAEGAPAAAKEAAPPPKQEPKKAEPPPPAKEEPKQASPEPASAAPPKPAAPATPAARTAEVAPATPSATTPPATSPASARFTGILMLTSQSHR